MKAARALLAWSQGDLAAASGVSEPTIARLETQDGPIGGRAETGDKLVAAMEKAGVEFIPENGRGAGVRMAGATTSRAKRSPASSKSSELAGKQLDRMTDASATADEQETRKRRLLKGPSEFRDVRKDRPKRKI